MSDRIGATPVSRVPHGALDLSRGETSVILTSRMGLWKGVKKCPQIKIAALFQFDYMCSCRIARKCRKMKIEENNLKTHQLDIKGRKIWGLILPDKSLSRNIHTDSNKHNFPTIDHAVSMQFCNLLFFQFNDTSYTCKWIETHVSLRMVARHCARKHVAILLVMELWVVSNHILFLCCKMNILI